MVCDKILGKIGETNKEVDTVSIEWFERDKKILKKNTKNGEEIGIRPDRPLNEGDILYEDENKIIAVEIAESDLIKIQVGEIVEMGRLCFEIGNRHLSLSIKPDCVKIPFDEPTFEYLKKLGFKAEKVKERFTDYKECKGHSHTHTHHHHEH
ncbi:MAG: urease accessory protein UreE [Eubacterium sp.]|nr:urease accessory protein UreE [Eubacterium sp.]